MKKELRDNLRDRRSLGMALLFPALSPLIVGFAVFVGTKNELHDASEPFKVAVTAPEAAPHLVSFLQAYGADVLPPEADPETAVATRKVDLAIVIESDFQGAIRSGEKGRVTVISDDARSESLKSLRRARGILNAYGATFGALRLVARGVSPAITNAVAIESRDVSTPESRASIFLLGLPLMLAIGAFIGGLYIAIDVTAGERERGSLEALAMNPVPRSAIGLGKLGAVCLFAAGSLVASGIGFALVPLTVPSDVIEIPLDLRTVALMVASCLPLVALASSLQVFVGTRAKGFKEAQASLSYISLVPMLPGMLLTANQGTASLDWAWVPIYGQQLLMGRWLRGETIGLMAWAPVVTTLALALLTAWLAIRRYEDERTFLA